jgi:lipopolysaccharide cholinephosphotransferase
MDGKKELSLEEVHQATLEVLLFVRDLCDKIGIKYYLAFGTLLGAARHSGFIPWDDDADIWMKREDYMKLFQYMDKHSDELIPYSYCSRENNALYPNSINRITNLSYDYIDTVKNVNMGYGVFVDVYPLDLCGNSNEEYRVLYKQVARINALYECYLDGYAYSGNLIKSIVKRAINKTLHVRFPQREIMLDWINRKTYDVLQKKDLRDSKKIGVVVGWGYNQAYDLAFFEKEDEAEFGGKYFRVPYNYKGLLGYIYGDYMKLPPEGKRVSYHGYKIYKK